MKKIMLAKLILYLGLFTPCTLTTFSNVKKDRGISVNLYQEKAHASLTVLHEKTGEITPVSESFGKAQSYAERQGHQVTSHSYPFHAKEQTTFHYFLKAASCLEVRDLTGYPDAVVSDT